mgnify:CR=1 FL=1
MNRIDAAFAELRAAGRTALIPYVTVGRSDARGDACRSCRRWSTAGADVIELGVPFSDPMADGPVIQRASERALAQGVGLAAVLDVVRAFRKGNATTPIVLMGYANPIEAMGTVAFADRARDAGVDGVLVVDYPPEEAAEFGQLLEERGIALIFLLAPTTPEARIAAVAKLARGYVYYVSLEGRDRRGTSRHRRRAHEARRDPPAREASRRRGLRHSRCGERAGDRRGRRCGRHRQPVDPGDRSRARGWRRRSRGRVARGHSQGARLDAKARGMTALTVRSLKGDTRMSWLQKLLPPRITSTPGVKKMAVPEGLWIKCPSCEAVPLSHRPREQSLRLPEVQFSRPRAGARAHRAAASIRKAASRSAPRSCPSDSLKFKDQKKYPERLVAALDETGETDALVVLQGSVKGVPLVLACFEFEFMGGSMGSVVGERFVRGVRVAYENRIPFVCISASGGARMQEGVNSLFQMAKTTAVLQELTKARLPFISILTDPTMGGVSASFAFVADIVLAEPGALIGFAGPRVIEQTVREKLPDGFQRAEFLVEKARST